MKPIFMMILIVAALLVTGLSHASARVQYDGDRVFIIDRTGTAWDVTQAKSLGFDPRRFQYGIGKNAFTPLGDDQVLQKPERIRDHHRVIGIRHKGEAHAYSVDRLRFHEIANTKIGDAHISAGY